MNQNITKCPACNSTKINIKKEKRNVKAPFGQLIEIEEAIIHCNDCDDDYKADDSDNLYSKTLAVSTKSSISSIIEYISNLGYSFTELERSLDLPFRTFSRWKSTSEIAAPAITLLRLLRTYPWLIEVADRKYNEDDATAILIMNAYKRLNTGFEHFLGPRNKISTLSNSNTLEITQVHENNATLKFSFSLPSPGDTKIYCEQNNCKSIEGGK
jgi:hypothetical protein